MNTLSIGYCCSIRLHGGVREELGHAAVGRGRRWRRFERRPLINIGIIDIRIKKNTGLDNRRKELDVNQERARRHWASPGMRKNPRLSWVHRAYIEYDEAQRLGGQDSLIWALPADPVDGDFHAHSIHCEHMNEPQSMCILVELRASKTSCAFSNSQSEELNSLRTKITSGRIQQI